MLLKAAKTRLGIKLQTWNPKAYMKTSYKTVNHTLTSERQNKTLPGGYGPKPQSEEGAGAAVNGHAWGSRLGGGQNLITQKTTVARSPDLRAPGEGGCLSWCHMDRLTLAIPHKVDQQARSGPGLFSGENVQRRRDEFQNLGPFPESQTRRSWTIRSETQTEGTSSSLS